MPRKNEVNESAIYNLTDIFIPMHLSDNVVSLSSIPFFVPEFPAYTSPPSNDDLIESVLVYANKLKNIGLKAVILNPPSYLMPVLSKALDQFDVDLYVPYFGLREAEALMPDGSFRTVQIREVTSIFQVITSIHEPSKRANLLKKGLIPH